MDLHHYVKCFDNDNLVINYDQTSLSTAVMLWEWNDMQKRGLLYPICGFT